MAQWKCWCFKKCGVAASAGPSRSWWRWCRNTRQRWSTSIAPPACPWSGVLAAVGMRTWSATPPTPQMSPCSCWKSGHQNQVKNMLRWRLWSTRHVNVESENLLWRLKGKGKGQEKGRERRDKKQKTVTGAKSLAGNCSGHPTPCCSAAHYLFPAQRQHQESPSLIYQYCVCGQRLKQLGWSPADGQGRL